MRSHVLLALGCLACGCAESTATEAPSSDVSSFHAGWRLRAHVWKGGGAEAYIDWSDQALGTACSFARLDDGSTRCAPTTEVAAPTFFDSACTEHAVVVDGKGPPPRYLRETAEACAGEWPTVTVLEVLDQRPASTPIYQRDGHTCRPTGSSGARVFAATVAAPSMFLRARVETASRGALDVELLTGEDGSRQIGRVIDHARGTSCTPFAPADEIMGARCLPTNTGFRADVTFVDASCSTLGVWGPFDGETCPAPTMAVSLPVAPNAFPDLFAVGPRAEMHFMEGAACVAEPQSTPQPFYAVGHALDASAFPAMMTKEFGDGRLRTPIVFAPGDDRPLAAYAAWGTFWDTALDAYCDPRAFTDGISRCVDPAAPDFGGNFGFADAGCTEPVVQIDGAAKVPRYATAIDQRDGALLPEIATVRLILGRFSGPKLYRMGADGVCGAVVNPHLEGTRVLGHEVAFDDAFERVAESLE